MTARSGEGSITVALNLSDHAVEVPLGPGERVLEGGLGPQEAAVIGTD
jgi:cyclomaltodextrinase